MLIAQLSDTHILSRNSDHPSRRQREAWLRQCVADINAEAPDAVIFTGDTVQHGQPDEYAVLQEALAALDAPLYLVPGNRDNGDNLRRAFSDFSCLPGMDDFFQYVVDEHPLRLVALDSTLPGERKGVFCERRRNWLEQTLTERPNQSACLFIHHPPFDVDDHYIGGYRNPNDSAALMHIVSRHPQVEALLCGHVHWHVEREWAGTQARITPSIAIDLRKGVDEVEANGRPIYMLHRWSSEQGLLSTARCANRDFDRLT